MAERNRILDEYSTHLEKFFGDDLLGIYLTGSIALGGYHPDKSDIDFTVVIKKRLDDKQIDGLQKIHADILKKYPKNILEGHYITLAELGKNPNEIKPVVTYFDGRMEESYHGITIVTWFTLKKYGVTVWGIPAKELVFDAPINELLSYVIDNVNSYWTRWLSQTAKPFSGKGVYALTSAPIEWGVSGVSRMFYTLSERDVTSKDGAIDYALKHMPGKYHRIIREASYIRTGERSKQYGSRFKRRGDMIGYIAYAINECNELAKQHSRFTFKISRAQHFK